MNSPLLERTSSSGHEYSGMPLPFMFIQQLVVASRHNLIYRIRLLEVSYEPTFYCRINFNKSPLLHWLGKNYTHTLRHLRINFACS